MEVVVSNNVTSEATLLEMFGDHINEIDFIMIFISRGTILGTSND